MWNGLFFLNMGEFDLFCYYGPVPKASDNTDLNFLLIAVGTRCAWGRGGEGGVVCLLCLPFASCRHCRGTAPEGSPQPYSPTPEEICSSRVPVSLELSGTG